MTSPTRPRSNDGIQRRTSFQLGRMICDSQARSATQMAVMLATIVSISSRPRLP